MVSVKHKSSILKQRVSLAVNKKLRSRNRPTTRLSSKAEATITKGQSTDDYDSYVEDVNQLFNNSDSASNFANSDLLFSNAPVSEFPVSENVSCNITDNPIIEVPDSDFHLYCYSNCTRGRRYNQEMIQCIMCMEWFHNKCSDSISAQTFWTCNDCRCLSQNVSNLKNQILELNQIISSLVNSQNDFYSKLCVVNTENAKLSAENKRLKKQLYEYRLNSYNKLSSSDDSSCSSSSDDDDDKITLSSPVIKKPNSKSRPKVKPGQRRNISGEKKPYEEISPPRETSAQLRKPLPTEQAVKESDAPRIRSQGKVTQTKPRLAVIGNSMIRNTGRYISSKLRNYDSCVYSTSGYSIDRAIGEVPEIVKDFTKNDMVVLCLGTVEVNESSAVDIASKYCVLVGKIKTIAPECNIVILSIAYRLHVNNKDINSKVDSINESLRSLCVGDSQCSFVNVNPAACSNYYREDGLHFNYRGRCILQELLVNKIMQSRNFPLPMNQSLG